MHCTVNFCFGVQFFCEVKFIFKTLFATHVHRLEQLRDQEESWDQFLSCASPLQLVVVESPCVR